MKLIQDKLSIVLAGSFNPAILTPQWIAKSVLGFQEGAQFPVQMVAPVAGLGGMTKYSFEGISYIPSFQNVTFFLGNLSPEGRQKVADTIGKILGMLPHTPILGVGINFGFTLINPSQRLLELLQDSDEMAAAFPGGAEIVSRTWANAVTWQGALVAMECQLDEEKVSVSANFHHNVKNASEAKELFSVPECYKKYYDAAIAVAEALTEQTLEE